MIVEDMIEYRMYINELFNKNDQIR